jgi:biotin-(acetyl-CoA carboxylase) ligase
MNQFFIGIIIVLGLGGYWLYQENVTLKANNLALEGAVATQQEALETMQNDFTLQTEQLQSMTLKSQAAQRELNRYSEFIRNYELSAKIMGDPVEMQRKINNGTKHIMEDIEELSNIVDDLDDGLQLQSPPNEDIRG